MNAPAMLDTGLPDRVGVPLKAYSAEPFEDNWAEAPARWPEAQAHWRL